MSGPHYGLAQAKPGRSDLPGPARQLVSIGPAGHRHIGSITMPKSSPRRRLSRDERMSRILSVTREMLAEKGHEGIVTAEVARRCGISEATIYKYFESKRDLLMQVAVQWFEELLDEDQPTLQGRSALDGLRQVVWRSLSSVRREPALTRFVLLDLRPD